MGVRQIDIAKEAGVSEATVSLALNNKGVVNSETQRRVLEVARKLGYVPTGASRASNSNVVGIVVTELSNVYFGQFVTNCINRLLESGYKPLIAATQDNYAVEEQVIDLFCSQQVGGLIIVPSAKGNARERYTEKLENSGIKYIFATAHYQNSNAPYVMMDLKKGAYLAVSYLLDMGHNKIFFLGTNPLQVPTKTRLDGYRTAYLERGMTVDDSLIIQCEDADFESSYLKTIHLLQEHRQMDAIVTINDVMALGCLRALREYDIRIPEDLSLIGYDDIVYSGVATIPLTTVHQDIEGLARRSVNLLLNMIQTNQQSREKILLEPHLVVRQSTGICRTKPDA